MFAEGRNCGVLDQEVDIMDRMSVFEKKRKSTQTITTAMYAQMRTNKTEMSNQE
jgi:hypothetical protein